MLLQLAVDRSEHVSESSLWRTLHQRKAKEAPIGRNSAKGKGAPRLYRRRGGGKGVGGDNDVGAGGRRAVGSDDVVKPVEAVEHWDMLLPSVVTDARVFSPRRKDPYLGFACYYQPIPHAADEPVSVVRFEPVALRPQNVHHITVFGCSADVVGCTPPPKKNGGFSESVPAVHVIPGFSKASLSKRARSFTSGSVHRAFLYVNIRVTSDWYRFWSQRKQEMTASFNRVPGVLVDFSAVPLAPVRTLSAGLIGTRLSLIAHFVRVIEPQLSL